jgi:hypothetical protein
LLTPLNHRISERGHRLAVFRIQSGNSGSICIAAFSASMGRHCLKGVGDIARVALAGSAE